jgi:hypothetical protein
MSSSTIRNRRLGDRIRTEGFLALFPCRSCFPEHECFVMPQISSRCARCAAAGRSNCIEVSWDSVDKVVNDTRKKISEEEDLADGVDEDEAAALSHEAEALKILEEAQKKVRQAQARRLEHRRKIRRLRKVLKLAENRSIAQAKCLAEELDAEAAANAEAEQSGFSPSFDPSVFDLASLSPGAINELLSDFDAVSPSLGYVF